MPGKTILFVMQHAGLVRNYSPSLRLLDERGHRVRIAYLDARPRKGEETGLAAALVSECSRLTAAPADPPDQGFWGVAARSVRVTIDALRYYDSRFAKATPLRDRALQRFGRVARAGFRFVALFGDKGVAAAIAALKRVDRAIPISPAVERALDEVEPDLVLVSPLVDFASWQVEYVKAAQRRGIPTGCCVASWDNLTNKGHMRVVPDRVFVWNEAQKDEAVALHGIPADNVVVTGAQIFDHWFGRRSQRTREEFCLEAGLDPERPFVIFLGSTQWIAPNELHFVEQWIRRIRASADPALKGLGILLRPHPVTRRRYLTVDLSQIDNVTIWPPYTPDTGARNTEPAQNDFFESLHYAAAAVGVNTSALIEAAIVGRITCTIRDDHFAHAQEGTLHFEHLVSTAGGMLRVADNMSEHERQLAAAIAAPDAADTSAFVEAFVRPHGLDQPAAPILARAIERAAALEPTPRRQGGRIGRVLVHPLAWVLNRAGPLVPDVTLTARASRAVGWTLVSSAKLDMRARSASKRVTGRLPFGQGKSRRGE